MACVLNDLFEKFEKEWARSTLADLKLTGLVYSTWDTPVPGVHWGLTKLGREAHAMAEEQKS